MPPITTPINDGSPVIGTWSKAFEKIDLKEIRKPFRFPLFNLFREIRIKEWQYFNIQDESYLLEAAFCNFSLYRAAQIFLYDKVNRQKFIFRKIKPGVGLRLPHSLTNSSVDRHAARFFFRIHNWLDADAVKLDLNIEESSSISGRKNPSLTAHLAYNMNKNETTPMVVSLGYSGNRSMYSFKVLAPVRGDIVFDGKRINFKKETCSGFFIDYKGYPPYQTSTTYCSAAGFMQENKRFGFHIAENQTRETNKNNENALWTNGKLTPLPPVLITMPNGPEADWIIQDVEGMVDLTFTPKEQSKSGANLLFTKTDLNIQLGVYNGMLMNADGEQFQIKNFFGMGEKLNLRV